MFSEVTEAREVAREDKAGEHDHEQALRDELTTRVGETVQRVTEQHAREKADEAQIRVRAPGQALLGVEVLVRRAWLMPALLFWRTAGS